jgi:diguanylate cyclase
MSLRMEKRRSAWAGWPAKPPPGLTARLSDALAKLQYAQLRENIPVIYIAVAAITVGAALANESMTAPPLQQAVPIILLLVSAIQIFRWRKRPPDAETVAFAKKQLFRTTILAMVMMAIGSIWSVMSFLDASPGRMPMAPVFMFFGAFAIANCIASVPRAALVLLAFGLLPLSITMILKGDAGFTVMAISVLLVGVLQARLVLQRFSEMAQTLILRDELESLARTDPLTGLLNRRALSQRLAERFAHPGTVPFVVAMLDLDHFKPVNDEHGHAVGDALLCALSARLTTSLREGDLVARLGGDEFALIFDAPRDLDAVAGRVAALTTTLGRPYRLAGHDIRVTASIGAAVFPFDGNTMETLFEAADAALYREKAKATPRLRAVPVSKAKR